MGRPGTSPPSLHKGEHSVTIETKHRHYRSCPHRNLRLLRGSGADGKLRAREAGTGEMLHVNKTAEHFCCASAAAEQGY